jgi:hypothetical protein
MAPTAAKNKHFAGHHIALIIDGDDAKTAFLKSAEGGMFKSATTEEPNAGYHVRPKHASVREIEPLTFEFGMAGTKWGLKLMQKICQTPAQAHTPFDGEILHADTNYKAQYVYGFKRARVTEFTFPKLDVKSKDLAFVKLKCQPEIIDFSLAEGAALHPGSPDKQKLWTCAAFYFSIGKSQVKASSIEALTVKVGSKAYQIGGVQNPQYASTGKLEMPKLSFVVPMHHAGKCIDWFRASIFKEGGKPESGGFEQNAFIEFLDQSRKKVLYTVHLLGCGPETCSVVKGSNDSVVAMKFDCYVTSMELEAAGEGII